MARCRFKANKPSGLGLPSPGSVPVGELKAHKQCGVAKKKKKVERANMDRDIGLSGVGVLTGLGCFTLCSKQIMVWKHGLASCFIFV